MRNLCLLSLACAGLSLSQPASAAQVAIVNGDFEEGFALAEGGFLPGHVRIIPGWVDSAGSGTGLWNPTSADFSDEALRSQVAWAQGNGDLTQPSAGTLAQTLPDFLIEANTLYTLTLNVGRRFGAVEWDYAVGLLAGPFGQGKATLLSSISGAMDHEGNVFQDGSFRSVRLSFQTGRSGPEIMKPLTIALGSNRSGAAFDSLRLEATPLAAVPEPASWAMMISGFGLVGGALRSRSRPTVTYAPSLV